MSYLSWFFLLLAILLCDVSSCVPDPSLGKQKRSLFRGKRSGLWFVSQGYFVSCSFRSHLLVVLFSILLLKSSSNSDKGPLWSHECCVLEFDGCRLYLVLPHLLVVTVVISAPLFPFIICLINCPGVNYSLGYPPMIIQRVLQKCTMSVVGGWQASTDHQRRVFPFLFHVWVSCLGSELSLGKAVWPWLSL